MRFGDKLETLDDLTAYAVPDDDARDPREEWDHACTMALFHNRYTLANESGLSTDNFGGWNEMRQHIYREHGKQTVIVPVWMIDHSGIALRAGRDFGDCDPGAWDSGIVGFCYMTPAQMRENYVTKRITKKILEQARELVDAEVKEYSAYLEGDVYGIVVKDDEGVALDSLWGMLGYSYDQMREQALDMLKCAHDGRTADYFPNLAKAIVGIAENAAKFAEIAS